MYGIKRKKSKNPTEQVRKTKDKKDMARMRRSSEQTLEYKIEQAEAKVAMKNSSRSYGEILAFITSGETSEDE